MRLPKETRLKPRVPVLERPHSVIPGFGLTLGYTVSYLSLIVLIRLSAVVLQGVNQPWASFKDAVFDTRTLLARRLTFGTAFAASVINAFFGLIVAWVLVRYDFPGRRILDALIDMPFALPTAVSGIALTAIYANNGWWPTCCSRSESRLFSRRSGSSSR